MTDGRAADPRSAPPSGGKPAPGKAPGAAGRAAPPSGGGRDRLAALTARRESAFPEALRHSARVTRLRRWILWGAGGTVALVCLGLAVSYLRLLPLNLGLSRVALQGSRIVIESPKLVGYRKDGKPYEIRARVGMQDIAKPDQFDLEQLHVSVEQGDRPIVLTAAKAVYNTKTDLAQLSGGVDIADGKNFDMRMSSASMDFKASVMRSDKPVVLVIEGGKVEASGVEFSQKERRATFSGQVHSVLYGEDGPPPQASKDAPAPAK